MPRSRTLGITTLLLALTSVRGFGAAPARRPPRFDDVRPLFTAFCLKCHGAKVRKAGVDLRSPASVLRGGSGGPIVVRGHPESSPLFRQVAEGRMPPGKARKPGPAQVAALRAWINSGADIPPDTTPPVTARHRAFWSFRPPRRPPVPRVRGVRRVRNPIDAFVLARLEAKGLTLAPEADRTTLARRLYLDLLALPPAPGEVDAFVNDNRPGAYERLVERVLASPHYGERWGRHWLDVAGYADTVGPDNDAEIIRVREGMWRYRDWVIRSLNADKPFDTFLTEQLAGDEVVRWRGAERYTPEIVDALVATGFLRTAVDNTLENELNRPLERWQVLHDTLENLGGNLLGLTVGCARCHDHKFDPIPQADYYRLLACLTPAYDPARWVQPQDRHLDDVSPKEKSAILRHNAEVDARVAKLDKQIARLRRPAEKRLFEAKLARLPAALRDDLRTALATAPGKRNMVQQYLAAKLGPSVAVSPEEVHRALKEEERTRLAAWRKEVATLRRQKRSVGKVQALVEVGPPPVTRLLVRGNHLTPGPPVAPGFPRVLTAPGASADVPPPGPGSDSSGRRTALARWVTRADHPLTARVFVNRTWQHLFGRGIVRTPDNFGKLGARPTHPELLDWLATEFVRSGWSTKRLHRLIVTSGTYRQASAVGPPAPGRTDPEGADPDNDLLWRQRLGRVESEVVRDAILTASGCLDPTMGGPPVPIEPRKDGRVVVATRGLPSPTARWRRSLYLLCRRNYQPSVLSVFDQPVAATGCTRRTASAVPLQALTLLNDDFVIEQAGSFARRVMREADGPGPRVERAFRLALARGPSAEEARWAKGLLGRQRQRYLEAKLPPARAEEKALAQVCQMLLCTNEFLYVE
jgi:hypothetical protein